MSLGDSGKLDTIRVIQVLSENRLLVTSAGETFILEGIDTAGVVDNRAISGGRSLFVVDRTDNYTSVIGARKTVFVLKVVPTDEADTLLEQIHKAEAEREQLAKIEADSLLTKELRTWKSTDGTFKVEARFVRMDDGVVTFRKADGTEVSATLEKLSDEDQLYIKSSAYTRAVE